MGRVYRPATRNNHRMISYPRVAFPEAFYLELPPQSGTLFYPPSPLVTLDSAIFDANNQGNEPPPYSIVWANWGPETVTDPAWPLASWLTNITVYRAWFGLDPFITVEVVLLTVDFPQPNPERIWRATYFSPDIPTGVPETIQVEEFISGSVGEVKALRFDQEPT